MRRVQTTAPWNTLVLVLASIASPGLAWVTGDVPVKRGATKMAPRYLTTASKVMVRNRGAIPRGTPTLAGYWCKQLFKQVCKQKNE